MLLFPPAALTLMLRPASAVTAGVAPLVVELSPRPSRENMFDVETEPKSVRSDRSVKAIETLPRAAGVGCCKSFVVSIGDLTGGDGDASVIFDCFCVRCCDSKCLRRRDYKMRFLNSKSGFGLAF